LTILQALNRYYDRLTERGHIAPYGYVSQRIGYALVLSEGGEVLDVRPLGSVEKGKTSGIFMDVPAPITVPKARTSGSIVPYFLWDKPSYLLGVETGESNTTKKYAASRALHLKALEDARDEILVAVRSFYERYETGSPPDLIPLEYRDRPYVFRIDTSQLFAHDTDEGKRIWGATQPHDEWAQGMCLVTGKVGPVERLHPKIAGFRDADSLVSFNEEAFRSYRQEKGANAPISAAAAHKYAAALSSLLEFESRQRVQIGGMTVGFWADGSKGETAAKVIEEKFAEWFNPPETAVGPNDAGATAELRDLWQDVRKGRAVELKKIDKQLEDGVRFYALGLSPNNARLSVRFWIEDDFENVAIRLAQHHADLAIEPQPWSRSPSIQRLLIEAFIPKRTRNPFTYIERQLGHLSGEFTRAVLTGLPYPRTLLFTALMRLRAGNDPGSGWHAVIKACINRSLRFRSQTTRKTELDTVIGGDIRRKEIPVARDPTYENPAYHLGRLFYVLVRAQELALDGVKASIKDRYFGSASSIPAHVFGSLLRGFEHHVSDLKKRGRRGDWLEPRVTEIMAMLPAKLPRTLSTEDQGRFVVGYYHERGYRPVKSGEGKGSENIEEEGEVNGD
jgi:CRISPR-associated protein Csd1